MTNETKTVNSQNHSTLHIPSREEFHRRYGGEIRGYDFCTDYYPISIGQLFTSLLFGDTLRIQIHKVFKEVLLWQEVNARLQKEIMKN